MLLLAGILSSAHTVTHTVMRTGIYMKLPCFTETRLTLHQLKIEKTYMLPQEQTCRNETQAQNLGHTLTNTLT